MQKGEKRAHVDSGPEPGEMAGALSRRPEESLAAGSLEAKWPEAGWWHCLALMHMTVYFLISTLPIPQFHVCSQRALCPISPGRPKVLSSPKGKTRGQG